MFISRIMGMENLNDIALTHSHNKEIKKYQELIKRYEENEQERLRQIERMEKTNISFIHIKDGLMDEEDDTLSIKKSRSDIEQELKSIIEIKESYIVKLNDLYK